jgi:general secretion pathway protein I
MRGTLMRTARKRVRGSELGTVRSWGQFGVGDSSEFQVQSPKPKVRRLTWNSELQTPNSEGFTLLEVLVALAVLAVALVSLLGLQNRNLLLSMQAERLSTGTLLVREMLTRTQLEGPEAARVTSGDFADLHPGQYPEFRWYRTVSPAPIEGLWELRVSVTWGERADEQAELTLFTPLG